MVFASKLVYGVFDVEVVKVKAMALSFGLGIAKKVGHLALHME